MAFPHDMGTSLTGRQGNRFSCIFSKCSSYYSYYFTFLTLDIFWVFSWWNYLASQVIFANSLEMTATAHWQFYWCFFNDLLATCAQGCPWSLQLNQSPLHTSMIQLRLLPTSLTLNFLSGVLILAESGLIFFLVTGARLCFGLRVSIMLTTHWCLVVAK